MTGIRFDRVMLNDLFSSLGHSSHQGGCPSAPQITTANKAEQHGGDKWALRGGETSSRARAVLALSCLAGLSSVLHRWMLSSGSAAISDLNLALRAGGRDVPRQGSTGWGL